MQEDRVEREESKAEPSLLIEVVEQQQSRGGAALEIRQVLSGAVVGEEVRKAWRATEPAARAEDDTIGRDRRRWHVPAQRRQRQH